MSVAELTKGYEKYIEMERSAGVVCGPFHQRWLLENSPTELKRRLNHYKDQALKNPGLVMMPRQGFAGMDLNDGVTAAFNARNTSASELNMIGSDINGTTPQAMINQFCAIPPNDARAGKGYRLEMGGIYGNTGTPTMIFTPRWGSSPTVATNITLGANSAWTSITGTTALPYIIVFTFWIRTAPPGATAGTGYGTGIVSLGIPATSSQMSADIMIGATAATIDTTGQGTAGCGLTMNLTWSASNAANTSTCQWFAISSLN